MQDMREYKKPMRIENTAEKEKMKYFFENTSEIEQKIKKAGGAILLFDFDGVLSAIAPTPEAAIITDEYASLLKQCADRMPVGIITGRTLENIRTKTHEKKVLYIASHGLEWEEDGQDHIKPIPKEAAEAIKLGLEKIKPLQNRYPGMLLEDKNSSVVVHYRLVAPETVPDFIKEVEAILRPFAEEHNLRLDNSIMNFELRPKIDWDKGDSALFAIDHFRKIKKDLVPIYIGDSATDEDAFEALDQDGISIRVNSAENEGVESAAQWYLKDQSEVGRFMKWLLSLNLE